MTKQTKTSWEEEFDDWFPIVSHIDDDYQTCSSSYGVCNVCGKKSYKYSFSLVQESACCTPPNIVYGECDCGVEVEKREMKAFITKAVEEAKAEGIQKERIACKERLFLGFEKQAMELFRQRAAGKDTISEERELNKHYEFFKSLLNPSE